VRARPCYAVWLQRSFVALTSMDCEGHGPLARRLLAGPVWIACAGYALAARCQVGTCKSGQQEALEQMQYNGESVLQSADTRTGNINKQGA
jgi:hypothetical protein